jgi:hypothetical protein
MVVPSPDRLGFFGLQFAGQSFKKCISGQWFQWPGQLQNRCESFVGQADRGRGCHVGGSVIRKGRPKSLGLCQGRTVRP